MINRIKLTLSQKELSALLSISAQELRAPSDEARIILRQELERRGLLDRFCDPLALDEIPKDDVDCHTCSSPSIGARE